MTQLSVTLPLFTLIALGFVAVRSGLVPKETLAGVGKYVLYFALPALIFRAISKSDIAHILDVDFLLVYGGGSLACFLLTFSMFKFGRQRTMTESSLYALGTALPNSVFIGIPVIAQLFDPFPISAFTMALLVENILIFPLALILMDAGSQNSGSFHLTETLKQLGHKLVRNPILISIFCGLFAAAFQLRLPGTLDQVVDLLANSGTSVALFFVGGVLVGSDITKNIARLSTIALGKLLVHPALVALLVWMISDFDQDLMKVAIIISAAPMLGIYPIVGAQYGMAQDSARKLVFTTSLSFITLSTVLWLVL